MRVGGGVCVYTYRLSPQLDEKLFALEGDFHYFQPWIQEKEKNIQALTFHVQKRKYTWSLAGWWPFILDYFIKSH